MLQTWQDKFVANFIEENRWKYLLDGLKVTLQITFFAVLIGIALGFLVAIVRSTYDRTGKLKILNLLCKLYLTVIRGTPVVVQLLIIYFVIFGSTDVDKVFVRFWRSVSIRELTWRRYSAPASCPSTTGSLKRGVAWDSITSRR